VGNAYELWYFVTYIAAIGLGGLVISLALAIRWLLAKDVAYLPEHELTRLKDTVSREFAKSNYPSTESTQRSNFLIEESKARVAEMFDGMNTMDTKAGVQLAALAALLSVVALFGPKDNTFIARILLALALAPLVIAILLDIIVLLPMIADAPDLRMYAAVEDFQNHGDLPRIKAEYAVRNVVYSHRLDRSSARKTRCLRCATLFLGAASVTVLAYLFVVHAKPTAYYGHCRTQGRDLQCTIKGA
jgi:hypothetical protein